MKSRALVPLRGQADRRLASPFKPSMPAALRRELKTRRPRYIYANGALPATFDKFETWRATNEPAVFFVQILYDGVTSHTERYVWVYRNGSLVEIEQFGLRAGRRTFVGWAS